MSWLLKHSINRRQLLLGTNPRVGFLCVMKKSGLWQSEWITAALAAAVMLLTDVNYSFPERHLVMSKIAAAGEMQNELRESIASPARNPNIAVEEEYQMARQQGTAQAFELFIARHPDHVLAEKARADLRRLSR